ncbi:kinetochore protein fta7 [Cordyceps javanica]|uniref:Kinetochore protein fta7 n=1 Tax=Cordyceps javanica TaxID=43265 RepID=A0A545V009_9HYPO|nr:kinetochore protein fta7 [Cordyceps javanica]
MASVANPLSRKRAVPSNASGNASRRQPAAEDAAARPLKRSRPSNSGVAASAATVPSKSRSSAAALLRGPNPSVARNRIGGQAAAPAAARPSLHDVTPSQIQNKPPPRRRSGQTKTNTRRTAAPVQAGGRSGATQRRQQQQESSPDEQPVSRSRSRRRTGDGKDNDGDEAGDSETNDDDEDEDEGPPSPEKPYPHVAPFTRRVRQSTIETKWSPLGRGSIKALTSILQLAHRPVLQRLTSSSSSQRAAPTEAALRLITKRILDKDGGRETELNFESVLDAKQTLERQLDPVLHAVDLLGAEARRMEAELEADYEALRLLEAEARARARESRGLLKKAHVLAPEGVAATTTTTTTTTAGGGAVLEDVSIKFDKTDGAAAVAATNPFQNVEDAEVKDMIAALGGHVDRLQANVEQTAGIGDQIRRTRASLQAVLAAKLGAQTYEHVVLGR